MRVDHDRDRVCREAKEKKEADDRYWKVSGALGDSMMPLLCDPAAPSCWKDRSSKVGSRASEEDQRRTRGCTGQARGRGRRSVSPSPSRVRTLTESLFIAKAAELEAKKAAMNGKRA